MALGRNDLLVAAYHDACELCNHDTRIINMCQAVQSLFLILGLCPQGPSPKQNQPICGCGGKSPSAAIASSCSTAHC